MIIAPILMFLLVASVPTAALVGSQINKEPPKIEKTTNINKGKTNEQK